MMKMTGRMLLVAFALVLVGANAAKNSCPAILEGTFTKVFQGSQPSGFHGENFDDSKWTVKSFPLATCPTCIQDPEARKPVSFVDPKQLLFSRTQVVLEGPNWGGELKLRLGGNSVWVWVNGRHMKDLHVTSETCSGYKGYPWRTVNIPEGLLKQGNNVIVLKSMVRSEAGAYVDMRLNVNQINPCWMASAVLQCPAIGQGSTTRTFQYNKSVGPPAGYSEVDFNDSHFEEQTFPLGENVGRCTETACLDINGWLPTNTPDRILTRTEFYLPHVPKYDAWLRLSAVEAWIQLNGEWVAEMPRNADCAAMEKGSSYTIPTSLLREGTNVLTVIVEGDVEGDVMLALPELNICDLFCPSNVSAWRRQIVEESAEGQEVNDN